MSDVMIKLDWQLYETVIKMDGAAPLVADQRNAQEDNSIS